MFWTIIQYLFIAFVFGVAVWYFIQMIKNTWGKKSTGCSKGCGCENTPKDNLG